MLYFDTLTPPNKLQNKRREVERLEWVLDRIRVVLELFRPKIAAMESGSFRSRGQVFSLGEMAGVIRLELLEQDVPAFKIEPSSLKKFFAGHGQANKDEMRAKAEELVGRTLTEDEADAYAVARVARYVWLYLKKDPGAQEVAKHSAYIRGFIKKIQLHRRHN